MQTHVEFVRNRRTGRIQRLKQVFGLGGNKAAHRFGRSAGFFEESGGTRIDHRSESFAGRRNPHRKLFADDGQFFLDLFLGADNGRADALGMVDDRVAFGGQLLHEAAHAQFIVRIAALERVDLGMNKRFELGGTGNRALDAVIHGRNFAAHRLTDGHNAVGGNSFRLGKTKRDFRHRAGGVAQVARARHHDREGKEQHDRHKYADDDGHQARNCCEISQRADVPKGVAIKKVGDAEAAERPDD